MVHLSGSFYIAIVMENNTFAFAGERFADLQMLRYRLNGFEQLSLQQKNISIIWLKPH